MCGRDERRVGATGTVAEVDGMPMRWLGLSVGGSGGRPGGGG